MGWKDILPHFNNKIMIRYILLSFFILFCFHGKAQTKPEVKNVNFAIVNDTMFIYYDLINSDFKELFTVSIIVKTTSGKVIYPKALSGEIGDNINGGKRKKIIWAITNDNAFIDEEGYVEITAKPIIAKAPEIVKNKSNISTGNALVRSTLFPGWGNSKLTGKPYWIIGIVSYGVLGAAFLEGLSSASTYNSYLNETNETNRDNYYAQAVKYDKTTKYLFATAGTLWVADFVLTAVQGKKKNKATSMTKNISVGYTYNAAMNKPMMMVRYKFN